MKNIFIALKWVRNSWLEKWVKEGQHIFSWKGGFHWSPSSMTCFNSSLPFIKKKCLFLFCRSFWKPCSMNACLKIQAPHHHRDLPARWKDLEWLTQILHIVRIKGWINVTGVSFDSCQRYFVCSWLDEKFIKMGIKLLKMLF